MRLGYQIEEHDNPADFFLDVILGNVESTVEPLTSSDAEQGIQEATAIEVEQDGITEKVCRHEYVGINDHFLKSNLK